MAEECMPSSFQVDVPLVAAAADADSSPPPPNHVVPKRTILDVFDVFCLVGYEREGTRLLSLSRPLLAAGRATLGTGRCVFEAAAGGDTARLQALMLRWRGSPFADNVINWKTRGPPGYRLCVSVCSAANGNDEDNIATKEPYGATPFMAACAAGHEAALEVLLGPAGQTNVGMRLRLDASGDDALVYAIRGRLSGEALEALRRGWGRRNLNMLERYMIAATRWRGPELVAVFAEEIASRKAHRSRQHEFAEELLRVKFHGAQGFLYSPVYGSVQEELRIGPMGVQLLAAVGVTTQAQLLGKYMSFAGTGCTGIDVAESFYAWLCEVGIRVGKIEITAQVGSKLDRMFPGHKSVKLELDFPGKFNIDPEHWEY